METPLQTCARLLSALEELVADEAAGVATGDGAHLRQLHERAAPLFAHLADFGPAVADAALRNRIAALIDRRQETIGRMDCELVGMRQKLAELEAARRRLGQVAPAYGRGAETVSRLREVG